MTREFHRELIALKIVCILSTLVQHVFNYDNIGAAFSVAAVSAVTHVSDTSGSRLESPLMTEITLNAVS